MTAEQSRHEACRECGQPKSIHCPNCGSCPDNHYVDRDSDHGMVGLDGDVVCRRCGTFVRLFNAD